MMGKSVTVTPTEAEPNPDYVTGRGDPQQRYRVYRLCICPDCGGDGRDHSPLDPKADRVKAMKARCPGCRGEGKTLDLVATAATPEGVGAAICQNAEEGAFEECPVGILMDGGSWLVKPWLPSPRNVSDAARVLAKSKKGE